VEVWRVIGRKAGPRPAETGEAELSQL
jgi:hypothetical protein